MKHKKNKLSILLLAFALTTQAQQSTTASGGDASGSGGTVAYSVGQIVYTAHTGTTGTVAQGVQQAYEISITTGFKNNKISLSIQAYPNPTADNVILTIDDMELEMLSFELVDISGKLIESKRVASAKETIYMENLASATYFLKITNNGKEAKTFKIIKN